MRKLLLFVLSITLLTPSLSFANDTTNESQKANSNQFSNWSLTFGGGLSFYDCDYTPAKGSNFMNSVNPSGAFTLTYDFSPVWGLTGMYSYSVFGVNHSIFMPKESAFAKYENGSEIIPSSVKGQSHALDLFINFDFVNAWFPHRNSKIFSLYLLAGAGMHFYERSTITPDGVLTHAKKDGGFDYTPAISLGGAAEFNVCPSIAIGLRALYQMYTSDKIEGHIRGSNNDAIDQANIYLRWKIDAKRKKHVRNCSMNDMLLASLDETQQISRDQQHSIDTLYISSKDTIVMINETPTVTVQEVERIVEQKLQEQRIIAPVACHYVYFETNSTHLSDAGLQAIQQVAASLVADDQLCLEIAAWCDNTGSDSYNKELGQKRADRVARELTTIYGIAPERLLTISRGKITNSDASYGPNRRVELHLRSKEELEQLKEEQATETTSASIDMAAAVVAQHAVNTKVKSDAHTTFARLAYKYYKNAHCWPFIYAANQKVVMKNNPNLIMREMEIIIPALSEAEINGASKANEQAMLAAIATK